jgi:hypothetical protein
MLLRRRMLNGGSRKIQCTQDLIISSEKGEAAGGLSKGPAPISTKQITSTKRKGIPILASIQRYYVLLLLWGCLSTVSCKPEVGAQDFG